MKLNDNVMFIRYQQAAPEARNYREKDGALCMMGCLADHMLSKVGHRCRARKH
jgi:hypothetical protein